MRQLRTKKNLEQYPNTDTTLLCKLEYYFSLLDLNWLFVIKLLNSLIY